MSRSFTNQAHVTRGGRHLTHSNEATQLDDVILSHITTNNSLNAFTDILHNDLMVTSNGSVAMTGDLDFATNNIINMGTLKYPITTNILEDAFLAPSNYNFLRIRNYTRVEHTDATHVSRILELDVPPILHTNPTCYTFQLDYIFMASRSVNDSNSATISGTLYWSIYSNIDGPSTSELIDERKSYKDDTGVDPSGGWQLLYDTVADGTARKYQLKGTFDHQNSTSRSTVNIDGIVRINSGTVAQNHGTDLIFNASVDPTSSTAFDFLIDSRYNNNINSIKRVGGDQYPITTYLYGDTHLAQADNSTVTAYGEVTISKNDAGVFNSLILRNENVSTGDVALRMVNSAGTASEFEIRHDTFGNTHFYSNQPDSETKSITINAGGSVDFKNTVDMDDKLTISKSVAGSFEGLHIENTNVTSANTSIKLTSYTNNCELMCKNDGDFNIKCSGVNVNIENNTSITGNCTITSSNANQLIVGYDANNYASIDVGVGGLATLSCTAPYITCDKSLHSRFRHAVVTPIIITDVGGHTWSAQNARNLMDNVCVRYAQTSNITDTLPSAADLIGSGGFTEPDNLHYADFYYMNNDNTYTITIASGASLSYGVFIIQPTTSAHFRIQYSSQTNYSIYRIA